MECPKGYEYDILREECIECEFRKKCKEDIKKNKKEKKLSQTEIKKEALESISKGIRDNFTASPDELTNYRSCVKVIKRIEEEYKKQGIRKKKNYKDRIHELKPEIKVIAKINPGDKEDLLLAKLNLIIDCAEYIVLGDI